MCSALDVIGAYREFARPLSSDQITWLLSKGVTPQAVGGDPDQMGYALAAGDVVFDDNSTVFNFSIECPDETPTPALIILARGNFGDESDLVAWSPRSGRVAAWLGAVSMLGEQAALAPRLGDEALTVHDTPLSWLAAGRTGIYIVNAIAARPVLDCASPLRVATVQQGLALRDALSASASPRILVPELEKAAA